MQYKKYNISKPNKYTKNGQEKTMWNNIGIMTEFTKDDGSVSRIIEIPAIGLEANVFPIEPKSQIQQIADTVGGTIEQDNRPTIEEGHKDYIRAEDIPF